MNDKSYKILVVEDEALVAFALEIELSDSGHTVVGPTTRVTDALNILGNQSVDGAILDVMLGREEVFPVADRLVEMGVPFLFHSGHLDIEKLDGRYDAPVHTKPCMPEVLIESLVNIVTNAAASGKHASE